MKSRKPIRSSTNVSSVKVGGKESDTRSTRKRHNEAALESTPSNQDNSDSDEDNTSPTATEDNWDILWPHRHGAIGNAGEYTLLLQINPEDAEKLDVEGSSGAIGRLELNSDGGKSEHFIVYRGLVSLVVSRILHY